MKFKTNYRVVIAGVDTKTFSDALVAHSYRHGEKFVSVVATNKNPRVSLTYKEIKAKTVK